MKFVRWGASRPAAAESVRTRNVTGPSSPDGRSASPAPGPSMSRYLMTPGKKKDLGKLASSLDEAIDIAYVFYRGIIEGSSHNFSKKTANLLSEDAFLKEVKDEAGFTSEQKVIIYQMALGYRDHVDRHHEMAFSLSGSPI